MPLKNPLRLISLVLLSITMFSPCEPTVEGAEADTDSLATDLLQSEFDLAGTRTPGTHYYHMETRVVQFSLDGKRMGVETYRLKLRCVPAGESGKDGDEYTCHRFTWQKGNAPPVTIPALDDWSYMFKTTESGLDERGQVFGIDHLRFANLVDSNENILTPDTAYAVYNTFIDFHSFFNVFAQRTHSGKGIQDLKTIGQKIVHDSAFSEPPIHLGSDVGEGSTFKNGEITLELKGLSLVDDRPCAIVAFDSGESSFHMVLQPMPTMNIEVNGGSHYTGDIYIDLASNWVRKVTMGELVVTEIKMPPPVNPMHSVIERHLVIRSVSKEDFAASF